MPIVAEKLNYTFMSGSSLAFHALKDISITINEGEFLAIIGHTGSGKSTLVQHFNGLVQPTSGTVTVDGIDLSQKKLRAKARKLVGMVFQYPEHQLFEESVYKDIAYGPRNMGLSDAEIKDRVIEAMSLVGLPAHYADKSPFELSGGEKRRTALAGIIAMRPKYLVLDEPMAGLDPAGRREIMQTITGLREALGCTIIMVSHSMDDVATYADRVAVLHKGQLVMCAPTRDVFNRAEELLHMGLDVPQASRLAAQLRGMGVDVPTDIYDIGEMSRYLIGRLRNV